MSPHVNNFVTDLVEMAKAMDELPKVQAELHEVRNLLNSAEQRCQDRELHIISLKADIEEKLATIRSLEVAKDAAETMFLEADDRTTKALDFVKATFGTAGALIQALEPPRMSEPVKAEYEATPAVSEPRPIQPEETVSEALPHAAETIGEASPGQSVSLPSGTGASVTEDTSQTVNVASETSGPYTGRRYIHIPGYISRIDWLAGGGTAEDYDFRTSPTPRTYD